MCIAIKTCDNELSANNFAKSEKCEKCDECLQDVLSISTIYTKIFLYKLNDFIELFKTSNFYKILCGTTQPAHLLTILAVSTIAFFIYPSKYENLDSKLATFFYIGSYCTHFGTQVWMTFVSGLALYFSLPRHTFGNVQKVLFPKYFALNSVLSLTTVIVFLRKNNSALTNFDVTLQAITLSLCFLIELSIRLYLTPPLIRLITLKNDMEEKAGVGMEVGIHKSGDLINNIKYVKVHKSFRKVHMTIAIGNIITLACSVFHLHYITGKLQIV